MEIEEKIAALEQVLKMVEQFTINVGQAQIIADGVVGPLKAVINQLVNERREMMTEQTKRETKNDKPDYPIASVPKPSNKSRNGVAQGRTIQGDSAN